MAWPVTINGHTYQASDFGPYSYVVSFPAIIGDVATAAGQVAADVITVATDKGIVAADKATVAADKGIVAADKLTVYNDRLLADAGALTASQVLGLMADSTTSITVAASGDKTFTVPAGKAFVAGMPMRASSKANPDTQFMTGVVKSYSTTSLVFTATAATGSATRTDWQLSVTGGALAPVGATQDIQAVARYAEKMDGLRAALVPDRPNLLLDFLDSTFFVRGAYAGASMVALIAALSGSSFTRASTGTFFGSNGLMQIAATNEPRLDYDPVTLQALGLLVESARTNLITYSEQFDDAAWGKTRATVTANATAAPDGAVTADKIVEDTTTAATHWLSRSVTSIATTVHTVSFYVKAAERSRIRLQLDDGATSIAACTYDLVAGLTASLTGTGAVAAIVAARDGWWRITLAGTSIGTTVRIVAYLADVTGNVTYTGDGTSGLHIWGGQLEVGSAPSSYIPTVASTVTRAVDFFQIDGASWYSAAGLTLFAEFSQPVLPSVATIPVYLGPRAGAFGTGFYFSRSATALTAAPAAAPVDINISAADSTTLLNRLALRVEPNDAALSYNGALSGTDVVCAPPTSPSKMTIGAGYWASASSSPHNGHIRRIAVFRPLANAKLQALTTAATWS